jgi:hypothetical protein
MERILGNCRVVAITTTPGKGTRSIIACIFILVVYPQYLSVFMAAGATLRVCIGQSGSAQDALTVSQKNEEQRLRALHSSFRISTLARVSNLVDMFGRLRAASTRTDTLSPHPHKLETRGPRPEASIRFPVHAYSNLKQTRLRELSLCFSLDLKMPTPSAENASHVVPGPRKRAARACQSCHERKVRCSLSQTGTPCTNCSLDGLVCELRASKRRR